MNNMSSADRRSSVQTSASCFRWMSHKRIKLFKASNCPPYLLLLLFFLEELAQVKSPDILTINSLSLWDDLFWPFRDHSFILKNEVIVLPGDKQFQHNNTTLQADWMKWRSFLAVEFNLMPLSYQHLWLIFKRNWITVTMRWKRHIYFF